MPKLRRVMVMIDLNHPVVHHHQIYAGIQRYANERGRWACSINQYPGLLLQEKRRGGIDGIVGRMTRDLAEQARKSKVPVVNVWLNSPAKNVHCVFHDAAEAGRMAARHLLARGFRKFAFLGYTNDRASKLQEKGFREILRQSNAPCDSCLSPFSFAQTAANWQRFQNKLGKWIDGWELPIGVYAAHDIICRYLAEACAERGLKVPFDVALMGTFNERIVCDNPAPALSSIDFGFERIGYQAAILLDRLIDGEQASKEPIWLPPTELLPRQSSDAFAVDDPMVAKALRFIAENAHKDVGVPEIAQHVSITRRTLLRAFKKSLGKTVHDAITFMRMERVKRFLIESDAPLKTLAAECGFSDSIHLCKVFQRIEGTSPSEYRAARIAQRME